MYRFPELSTATPLGRRTDLRRIPLITVDGVDARDFDDAVYAEPDGTGHRLIVPALLRYNAGRGPSLFRNAVSALSRP